MNLNLNLVSKFKLKIVIHLFNDSWENSKIVAEQNSSTYRLIIFFDMLFSLLLFGADSWDYMYFDFCTMNLRGRNEYITYTRNIKLRLWTSEEAFDLFNDKIKFNEKYSSFISRDWISTLNKSSEEIIDFITKYKTVIVKPPRSTWGIGIYKLNYLENESIDALIHKVRKGEEFLIEEVVENENTIKSLNPSSLNTLRVVTFVDPFGKAHIIKYLIRIGTTDSCVDNACSGGIACSISSEYGIIDSIGKTIAGSSFLFHPKSHIKLLGLPIPFWDDIETYINELTKVEPKARYVGWDIAVTNNGFELIEGNMSPGEGITQMCDNIGKWNLVKSFV